MTEYQREKERVRRKAIEWQNDFLENNYSYEELIRWEDYFRGLAERYDLVEEFEENGII